MPWRRAWPGGVKRDVFFARARGYASSLEAALEPAHIPTEVFHNVIRTFRENVGTWHRYWRVRRQALGLDALKPYDTRAQIGAIDPEGSLRPGRRLDRRGGGAAG